MTGKREDWRGLAAALATRLAEERVITDQVWRDVVAAVPRHVFVPAFYSDDDPPELLRAGDPRWLPLVYSDETLVTQRKEHPDQPGFHWSTSSSTRPGLMLRMLHILDIHDRLDVLEIGTGTGYNAALLSERLGSERVTTVDIDPELADAARKVWWRLPGINAFPGPDTIQITTPDGAWAEVTRETPAKVRYGGPGDIWRQVEQARGWWDEHARPGVESFELTVGPGGQRLWFRAPDGQRRPVPGRP